MDFSPQAQGDFLFWAEQALSLDTETRADFPWIRALSDKYADLPADFADASLIALCERLGSTTVASVDSDFTSYQGRGRQPVGNLFFEVD